MNNPKPGEWRADELSQNYIADYKPFNFVDGEGRSEERRVGKEC